MKNNLLGIIGGAYSGKTQCAEQIAQKFSRVAFFGTLRAQQPGDELSAHIAELKKNRPAHWKQFEASFTFDDLKTAAKEHDCIVFDCLTMWLAWCLTDAHQKYAAEQLRTHVAREFEYLMQVISSLPCRVIIVSGEVGCGVVPSQPSGRMFREIVGKANLTLNRESGFIVQMASGNALLVNDHLSTEAVEPIKKVTPTWLAAQLSHK